MQLSFIALYVNAESVFKSCLTLRGLGDKGCHLVESPLQYLISAPPRSTQHDEKPLGLFWQFRPSTSNNNNTLYHNLLQYLSIRRKTRDRAERQFTQLLLSDGSQKKPARKKPRGGKKSAGNLGRNHGSNS